MTSYPCTICERVFSRRSSLRNHVKTHDNILVDRVLREISQEQQFGQENPVFSGSEDDDPELTGDEQREEFKQEENTEEEEQEEENPEEEQEEENPEKEQEEENPEKEQEFEQEESPEKEDGSSSHSSLSLDGEEQEETEETVVIISYFIYTSTLREIH